MAIADKRQAKPAAADGHALAPQLPLFVPEPPALAALRTLDPEQLSPRDALACLFQLKELL